MKRKIHVIKMQDAELHVYGAWHQKNGEIGVFYHLSLKEHWFLQSPRIGVPLWKSESPAEKFQHSVGGKKSQIGCIESKRKFPFPTSPIPCPPKKQLSSQGEVECEWVSSFSTCVGHCQRGPLLPHSIQDTEVCCAMGGGNQMRQ